MGYDDDIITEIARVVVNGTAEHVSLKGLKAHISTTENQSDSNPGLTARDTQCTMFTTLECHPSVRLSWTKFSIMTFWTSHGSIARYNVKINIKVLRLGECHTYIYTAATI